MCVVSSLMGEQVCKRNPTSVFAPIQITASSDSGLFTELKGVRFHHLLQNRILKCLCDNQNYYTWQSPQLFSLPQETDMRKRLESPSGLFFVTTRSAGMSTQYEQVFDRGGIGGPVTYSIKRKD